MSELIKTHLLEDPEGEVPMDRASFYKEQTEEYKKLGKPTRAVAVVQIFMFNSKGELLIQKRSFDKAHNAGLLDKSIGGHLKFGDRGDHTVMMETIQELQAPSMVFNNETDFLKVFGVLRDYLSTTAVIQHMKTELVIMKKIINDEEIEVANKNDLYFGIFDGRVRAADNEAKGVLWYTLEELDKEMEKLPEAYTYDMHHFVGTYRKEMEEFLELVTKQ